MMLTVLKIEERRSKFGGIFYYLFAKDEQGKSYRTCLYPQYGNFRRWRTIIQKGTGTVIDNVICKGQLIDADSFPIIKEI